MKAVVITSPGGPEVLQVQEVENPRIADGEVLIKVAATALNRADTLQRQGKYPPPAGASPYPGLECSGTVEAVGKGVSRWKIGDQVCALLSGGGYAEKVAVPAGQVLPIPEGISLVDAASFPEVACTVWSTVYMMCNLAAGETFLVHGGSSGIGTFAIQLAKHRGVRVFVTAGGEEKLAVCKDLGADVCINYKTEDFVARVKEETGGKGVDVILDSIGASYFQRNLESLNMDGRLFLLGFQTGAVTQVNLASIFAKRIKVQGAGLRSRTPENKATIVSEVEKNVWPAIAAGKVKPVIFKSFPFSDAAEAHRLMESSHHIAITLLFFITDVVSAKPDTYVCRIPPSRGGHCFLKPIITCPSECPTINPKDPNAKACYINCYSPKCEATCRKRKPDCNSPGSACYDPRFIGADGMVFYFHGKSNQHFSLVSDPNLQINARFIGHRPSGRTRDYTWIQGLGIIFGSHTFTVEAKQVAKWDNDVDQFQFSYDGKALTVPESHLSEWNSPEQELRVERTSMKNSVTVTLPSNDCFAHLEVQFRFMGLSPAVEGVLGRTYRPDFKNPAKPGVPMPVVGGEDKYRTSSLVSANCAACTASFEGVETKESSLLIDYGMLDCTSGGNSGRGIVCRR